jgi:hypothetical protein
VAISDPPGVGAEASLARVWHLDRLQREARDPVSPTGLDGDQHDVLKPAVTRLQHGDGLRGGEEPKLLDSALSAPAAERGEPAGGVSVGVRQHDGVERPHVRELILELGRGVDEDTCAGCDQQRALAPLRASSTGRSAGGAGAEERQAHRLNVPGVLGCSGTCL